MPAATTSFNLSRIGQIMIPVRDLARAVGFYRDTLGMSFLFQVPRLAFFDCGGVRLMLGVPEGEAAHLNGTIIYYRVEDIQAAVAALRERGVETVSDPNLVARLEHSDLWLASFRDSEDNLVELMSEVAR